MATDWRDSLKALQSTLDPGTDSPVAAQTEPSDEPAQGRLDVVLERKGRGGKIATIVTGFTLDDDRVARIAARLKKSLGTGGSARGGEILIQGDRTADVVRLLIDMGFKARRI